MLAESSSASAGVGSNDLAGDGGAEEDERCDLHCACFDVVIGVGKKRYMLCGNLERPRHEG